MKRRLIRQGDEALTTTLPHEWIQTHRLKAKDEIDLQVEGDAVVIRPGFVPTRSQTSMHLPWMDLHGYRHFLANAYRKGFDEIRVKFDSSEQFADIKSVVEELLGFEIVTQGQKYITLKSVTLPDIEEYPALFKRTFHILNTGLAYLCEDIETQHLEPAKILALQKDQLRLVNFCKRIILNNPAKDRTKASVEDQLLTLNDHAMSQLKYVYLSVQKIRKPRQAVLKLLRELQAFFAALSAAIFKQDQNALALLVKRKYQLYETKQHFIAKAARDELVAAQELGILLRLLTDYVGLLSFIAFKPEK
ncbi:AbrB/MazE/SpoVT family DNA-binding domain-containing protein [Candidatus Woesearchaeota archaeon]|nr:AbrB/MazE/SpoVT family DNA-binding domain-containing protein [Candidatus Woesearchaeota archaeon]